MTVGERGKDLRAKCSAPGEIEAIGDTATGGEAAISGALAEAEFMNLSGDEERAISIFRALGQPARFALWRRIARKCCCLGEEGEYCSGLQASSGLSQGTVSHHLRVLREAGMVEFTEQGTWSCYWVSQDVYEAVMAFLSTAARR